MSASIVTSPTTTAATPVEAQRVSVGDIWRTLLALLQRDAVVTARQFHTSIVLLLIQPALLLLALGRIQEYTHTLPASFVLVLMPGILGAIMVTVGIQSVTMPLVVEFGFSREIEDRLLAPIPVWLVGFEKVLVGTIKSLICCALYFPIAWVVLGPDLYHVNLTQPWLFIAAALLTGVIMSSLGLLLGSAVKSTQMNVLFAVLLVPMSFLGCVYFPWPSLSSAPVLQYLTLIDPQTYISEALRGTMAPDLPHMGFGWIFAALVGWATILTLLSMRAFVRKTVH